MKDGFLYSLIFHLTLCAVLFLFAPISEIRKITSKKTPVKIQFLRKGYGKSLKTLRKPREDTVRGTPKETAPSLSTAAILHGPPVKATKVPVKATKVPVKATKVPVKATKAPVKATKAPVKATKPPVKATKAPVKATKKPVRATKPPVKVAPLPDFGMSVAERMKSAWAIDPALSVKTGQTQGNSESLKLATVPDIHLPALPDLPFETTAVSDFSPDNVSVSGQAEVLPGMRTQGSISKEDTWYLSAVKDKLNSFWVRPSSIYRDEEQCVLAFRILRSGQVVEGRISEKSGNQAFDDSVFVALNRAANFEPLPKRIGDEKGEVFFLTFVLKR